MAGKTLEKRLNLARLERYLLPLPSVLLHADADNVTRFLFALTETLERLNSAQFNALLTPQRTSSQVAQRFERAVLSVNEGAEGHLAPTAVPAHERARLIAAALEDDSDVIAVGLLPLG